jgi:hypothetical protein
MAGFGYERVNRSVSAFSRKVTIAIIVVVIIGVIVAGPA